MIIAIPTNDKKTISEHFGRSEYFLIYNTETKEKKYINNPHVLEENDTIGHAKLLKALKTENSEKIICYNVGMRMGQDLKKIGAEIEFTKELEIEKHLKTTKQTK